MNGFFTAVKENASFVGVCLVTVLAITLIAYGIEKAAKRKNGDKDRVLATRKIVMIGMFGAISGILYCFDFALPIAPNFYKLDFSELPALIAGFAFGPVAGVLVEFVKQVVKLMIKSTSTAFVGDLANYLIGCMLVLPASVIYRFNKSKRSALIGCAVGTIVMTIFGTWFNAILGMGAAINPAVTNITNFVILMVAPINLIKGIGISALTMLIYKKISPIIKYGASAQESVRAAE